MTLCTLVEAEFAEIVDANGQILLLCAVDDNYAMPLAVMLQSVGQHLATDKHVHVLLIDGGISKDSQSKLEKSLTHLAMTVYLVEPDHSVISDLAISHHATHSVYFRLLAGLLLPDCIDRIIYLDADLMVRADIVELWEQPLGDNYCLAVPDIACPYISARHVIPNLEGVIEFLATDTPVQNWKQLGLDPESHYFNSGVMLINLKRWRTERIEQALLATLRENEKYVWCWDQYALNVVFSGQWGKLPYHWNQGAQVFQFPSPGQAPIPEADFIEMRDKPSIIHFTTEWKPWKHNKFHPLRETFLNAMDRTEFGGWRPIEAEEPQLNVPMTRLERLRRNPRKFIARNLRRALGIPGASTQANAFSGNGEQSTTAITEDQHQTLLLFIHLPKCAGTTLIKSFARLGNNRHLIVSNSGSSKTDAFNELSLKIKEREADPNKLNTISGHDVFFGMHEISPRPCLYSTVLREPTSRYISHYRFFVDCAFDQTHVIHDYARNLMLENGAPISLRTFTERKLLPDTMATYLASAYHPVWATGRADLKDPDQILVLAEGALRHMGFIGLIEEFPSDLERLCSLVGLKPAAAANRSSHSIPEGEIDDELREMILANNRLDQQVYELAKKIRGEKLAL